MIFNNKKLTEKFQIFRKKKQNSNDKYQTFDSDCKRARGAYYAEYDLQIIFGFAIIGLPFYSRIEQETFDGR